MLKFGIAFFLVGLFSTDSFANPFQFLSTGDKLSELSGPPTPPPPPPPSNGVIRNPKYKGFYFLGNSAEELMMSSVDPSSFIVQRADRICAKKYPGTHAGVINASDAKVSTLGYFDYDSTTERELFVLADYQAVGDVSPTRITEITCR